MSSFCSYYNAQTCRSCSVLEEGYDLQLKAKEEKLRSALKLSLPLLPTVRSELEHFRNKAKLIVTGSSENPIIGLLGEGTLDEGREILACPLHHPKINQLLSTLKSFITLAKLQPYSLSQKKGELKGLILFHSDSRGESYLRFVLRSKESLDRIKKHLGFLIQEHPHLQCVSASIQPIHQAILEGEEEVFLTERHSIHHMISGVTLELDPRAFSQTNEKVAQKLYTTAAQWIDEIHPKKFAELFCGQGAFSFSAARSFEQGLGIEINPQAVKTANVTAHSAGLAHLHFKSQDASLAKNELWQFRPEVILVNPPRRGLGGSVEWLLEGDFNYLLYSSCSHESLATDLEKMKDKFKIERVQIFDMFPHTHHFETLVLLKKNHSL